MFLKKLHYIIIFVIKTMIIIIRQYTLLIMLYQGSPTGGPGRAVNRRPAARSMSPQAGRVGPWAFLNKPKWLLKKGRERGGFEPLPSCFHIKALTN